MDIRIASTAYALPPATETVAGILEQESARVEAALRPLTPAMRERVLAGLGIERVRVCREKQPYELALEAASAALDEAQVRAADLDLVIDFTTLPGRDGQFLSFAQRLSADLGIETSLNLSLRVGGCGGLHLAFKTAKALMLSDPGLRTALLVAGDGAPAGSRSLLPVTIQSDAASAVILRKDAGEGPALLETEVVTLAHLYDAIRVTRSHNGFEALRIDVDSARIEHELMPIYYLNFYRIVQRVLQRAALGLSDIDRFVYSNLSRTDRVGFFRALRIPEEKGFSAGLAEFGHTFASDLVINYTDMRRVRPVAPGELLLFASAGIGFTWGVTLARA